MKGPAKLILTIIEIVLIICVAFGFMTYSKKSMSPEVVYQFNRKMPVNTVIQESDISQIEIPEKAVTSNMVRNKEDIVGKAITTTVFPNTYVYSEHLIEASQVNVFEGMDLSNYRKFAMKADIAEGMTGELAKGQKIDLVFVGEGTNQGDPVVKADGRQTTDSFTYATTFMQSVLIWDIVDEKGNTYVPPTENTKPAEGENVETQEEEFKGSYIILAVTMDQYEELLVRMQKGSVGIVNRFEDSVDVISNGYVIGDKFPVTMGPGQVEVEN